MTHHTRASGVIRNEIQLSLRTPLTFLNLRVYNSKLVSQLYRFCGLMVLNLVPKGKKPFTFSHFISELSEV